MPFLQSLHPAPDQVSVAFMGKGSFDCKADIFEIVRSTIEPGAIILVHMSLGIADILLLLKGNRVVHGYRRVYTRFRFVLSEHFQ